MEKKKKKKAISLTCTIFCSTRFPSSNRLHCLTEIPAYDTQLRQNMAISTGLWSTFLSQRSWLLCCWNSSRLGCPVHAQFLLFSVETVHNTSFSVVVSGIFWLLTSHLKLLSYCFLFPIKACTLLGRSWSSIPLNTVKSRQNITVDVLRKLRAAMLFWVLREISISDFSY